MKHTNLLLLALLCCFCSQLKAAVSDTPFLKWGTYRPGRHFGVRAKHPNSPLIGLTWFNAMNAQLIHVRDQCEERDNLERFGWQSHNGRDFGKQTLLDPLCELNLTVTWSSVPYSTGSSQRNVSSEAWVAMVEGRPYQRQRAAASEEPMADTTLSTVWYVSNGAYDNSSALLSKFQEQLDSEHFSKKDFSQVFGKVPLHLDATATESQLLHLSEASSKAKKSNASENYSLVQIRSEKKEFLNWGDLVRPKKKKKYFGRHVLEKTQMTNRTFITAMTLEHRHKWRSKEALGSVLRAQGQRLRKAVRPLVKQIAEAAGRVDDAQYLSMVHSTIVPSIRHGFLTTIEREDGEDNDRVNLILQQQFHKMPFRFFIGFVPEHKFIESWEMFSMTMESEMNEPLFKCEDDVVAFLNARQVQFDEEAAVFLDVDAEDAVELVPLKDDDSENQVSDKQRLFEVGRAALSGVLSGIGYWSGSQVFEFPGKEARETAVTSLFSGSPSRSFFPRGFLWDEGFHNLMISMWDPKLSVDILKSWFDSMQADGWIPREQIVGAEARARVPDEFVTQRPTAANPPTLFLAIRALLYHSQQCQRTEVKATTTTTATESQQQCDASQGVVSEFISEYYDKLKTHFEWYLRTQTSHFNADSFRWNGRTNEHNLPSGLDDFPRFPNNVTNANISQVFSRATDSENLKELLKEHVCALNEGHVDLHSWVLKMYEVMAELASVTGRVEDSRAYAKRFGVLRRKLDELHWDESDGVYYDYVVLADENGVEKKQFVKHVGYVSIFPLALELLEPTSPKLRALVRLISPLPADISSGTEQQFGGMYTDWGLRSLAKSDAMYGSGENYWRGAIWMNLNYLTLRALHRYGEAADLPADLRTEVLQLYKKLRTGIIRNVEKEFRTKGFLFENYNEETGNGQKNKGFTGWTALIANIIGQRYV